MMKTSQVIKQRQYQPIKPFWTSEDGYQMKFYSETHPGTVYITTRDRRHRDQFYCTCPATGLCKHITSLVLSFAAPRYERTSVWTADEDAENQRRRDVYEARGPSELVAGSRAEVRPLLISNHHWISVVVDRVDTEIGDEPFYFLSQF